MEDIHNYIIFISIILGLFCLLLSRYSGRELEKCETTAEKFSLVFCLIFAWFFNSFFIWLAIEGILLEFINNK